MQRRNKNYWLYFGFTATALYAALVCFFIHQYEAGILDKIAAMDLNSIGDMLAGVFAPLAFLWLFVATMMQSEELKLQRAEIEENRKVMEEQAAAAKDQAKFIASQAETLRVQTDLLSTQNALSERTAYLTHKVSLFDKRMRIYDDIIDVRREFEAKHIYSSVIRDLTSLRDKAVLFFGDDIVMWFEDTLNIVSHIVEKYDSLRAHRKSINKVAKSDLDPTEIQLINDVKPLVENFKAALSDEILAQIFSRYLKLNAS